MVISNSHQFVFVHIHKCGGTSVGKALSSCCGPEDTALGYRRFITKSFKGDLNKHSHADHIRKVIGEKAWNSYFKFAFVRNPYARTASFFTWAESLLNSVSGIRRFIPPFSLLRKEIYTYPVVRAFIQTNNFSEFIRHPEFHKGWGTQKQCNFVCDPLSGEIIVDMVAKVENAGQAFEKILKEISLSPSMLRLPHLNKSSNLSYRVFYKDPADQKYVAKHYADDFEKFNYPTTFPG